MSVNVEQLLNKLDETEMVLVHGWAWRTKLRRQIFEGWAELSPLKRAWWTIRGKRPV